MTAPCSRIDKLWCQLAVIPYNFMVLCPAQERYSTAAAEQQTKSKMSATSTAYLNETVGGLLSQGVAATVASQPADPVEFLAEWLLRRVQADAQRERHAQDKQQQQAKELRRAVSGPVQHVTHQTCVPTSRLLNMITCPGSCCRHKSRRRSRSARLRWQPAPQPYRGWQRRWETPRTCGRLQWTLPRPTRLQQVSGTGPTCAS